MSALLVRSGGQICAVPLPQVEETLRPLPLQPLAGMPPYLSGLSVIRGTPTPVVDLTALLAGARGSPARRWVTLRLGARRAALAVDDVLGVSALGGDSAAALPPLVSKATSGAMGSLGALDEQLLWVLNATRLLSEEEWRSVSAQSGRGGE
jgi:purine-binding chemotaxis protein CheW